MSNGKKKQPTGEKSPLDELLKRTGLSHDGLAGLITYLSGQKISGETLRRRGKEGRQGWDKLTLTTSQWLAVAQLMKIPPERLHDFFQNPEAFLESEEVVTNNN